MAATAQVVWQANDLCLLCVWDGYIRWMKQVRWNRNGTRIAFVRASQYAGLGVETDDLFVFNTGSAGLSQVKTNQAGQTISGQTIQGISWSPDDTQMAFDVS